MAIEALFFSKGEPFNTHEEGSKIVEKNFHLMKRLSPGEYDLTPPFLKESGFEKKITVNEDGTGIVSGTTGTYALNQDEDGELVIGPGVTGGQLYLYSVVSYTKDRNWGRFFRRGRKSHG